MFFTGFLLKSNILSNEKQLPYILGGRGGGDSGVNSELVITVLSFE
jgi:hypothetical protein